MNSIELEAAVDSGVISADVARRLRNFTATQTGAPEADEERFGVVGGMADVMTAAGLALLLGGGAAALSVLGPFAVVPLIVAIWLFAEHFTRRRKLTLTSFALFAAFAVSAACLFLAAAMTIPAPDLRLVDPGAGPMNGLPLIAPLRGIVVALGTTMACALYWWRFQLPIAFTVTAVAAINVAVQVLRLIAPGTPAVLVSLVLLASGLALFALAMWWDISDVRRETRRADVAFWLHCAAGFQLAGATFRLVLGVPGNPHGWDRLYVFAHAEPNGLSAVAVLAVFALFCLVALAVDRRSLMLSSLGYVFPAMLRLFGGGIADAPVVIPVVILAGAFLVLLAARWRQMRMLVLARLPVGLRANLPRTDLVYERLRPVR